MGGGGDFVILMRERIENGCSDWPSLLYYCLGCTTIRQLGKKIVLAFQFFLSSSGKICVRHFEKASVLSFLLFKKKRVLFLLFAVCQFVLMRSEA